MKFKFKFGKNANPPVIITTAVIIMCLLVEFFVIYKYIYLALRFKADEADAIYKPQIRLDLNAYHELQSWFEEKRNYQLPPYALGQDGRGRENPFAEY